MSSLKLDINENRILTIPIRQAFPLPGIPLNITLYLKENQKMIQAIQEKMHNSKLVVLLLSEREMDKNRMKNEVNQLKKEDLYEYGTLALINTLLPSSSSDIRIQVQTLPSRFKMDDITIENTVCYSNGKLIDDFNQELFTTKDEENDFNVKKEVIKNSLRNINQSRPVNALESLFNQLDSSKSHFSLVIFNIFNQIDTTIKEKYEVLKMDTVSDRIEYTIATLSRIETHFEIQAQTMIQMQKEQKEYSLKAQKRAIDKELEGTNSDSDPFIKEILAVKMPIDVKKIRDEEIKKYKLLSPQSSDYHVVRTYLEWLASIPWMKTTKDNMDIVNAKALLDSDHYGLDVVKKRILEFLSVSKLKGSFRGQTLCLVGPPGVGKTSLAKSIAKAVNRKFIRISLGGVHDESEIRGHRKTYVGSMPGKLITSLKKIEVMNPIILLDEIDKLGKSAHGDPSAAMLEVLDPEQNNSFADHYMNTPVDLSNVFFIATANDLSEIPGPLRDRMEIIHLGSYTLSEKKHIAINHLVKQQLTDFNLNDRNITFEEEAITKLIHDYTRESGVRDLKRKIGQICRYIAQEVVEDKLTGDIVVNVEKVKKVLGNELVSHEKALEASEIGIVSGLAWTSVGGEMLFIEANMMPGHGNLVLTGSLGEVMKESARLGLSYIKSNAIKLGLDKDFDFSKHDIHLHFPSGATPKDGPSAGIAICTCLLSLLTSRKVNHTIAMTGEISLRGKVLPVGGIKEKVIAAHRAGIKTVILPNDNKSSLDEIPKEVKEELEILFMTNFDEVMDKVLEKKMDHNL